MFKFPCFAPKIMLKMNKVKYGKNLKMIGWPFIFKSKNSEIEIGDNCTINSNFFSNLLGLYQRTIVVSRYGGKIKIGNNVGISGSTIYSWKSITIGNDVKIGANTKILDNDFHPIDAEARIEDDKNKVSRRSVEIGNNAFIGCNCIILKGTKIGKNCVVGAGSVVSGEFEDNCIIAGNPAKVIKKLV